MFSSPEAVTLPLDYCLVVSKTGPLLRLRRVRRFLCVSQVWHNPFLCHFGSMVMLHLFLQSCSLAHICELFCICLYCLIPFRLKLFLNLNPALWMACSSVPLLLKSSAHMLYSIAWVIEKKYQIVLNSGARGSEQHWGQVALCRMKPSVLIT